jgi:hypothetical protein
VCCYDKYIFYFYSEIFCRKISLTLLTNASLCQIASRLSSVAIGLLGISALFSDVTFYWVVLIFFLQRGPIAPLSEEITDPEEYYTIGVAVLLFGLLVCLPYPFPFDPSQLTNLDFDL